MRNILKASAILIMGLLVACGDKSTEPTKDNHNVATATEESNLPLYRVATVATYPPFATKDEKGVITGFDIDVLKAIAKNQGFQVEFVTHPWDNWKEDLTKKKDIQIWTAGISINDDRKQFTDFSVPYMNYSIALFTADNASLNGDISTYKIGVEEGTSDVDIAKSIVKNPQQVKEFPSHFIAIEALLQKKIDAIVGNEMVLKHLMLSFPEYKFKSQVVETENAQPKQLGFMVRKGSPETLKQLNQGIKAIKANGEFNKIKQKWFGNLDN